MILRFETFEFDNEQRELRRNGVPLPLEPKAFTVLAYILTHRDRAVTKAELLDTCWPDEFVSESALARSIRLIRQAVGDDGNRQQMIKTVRGYGYRFVAAVTTIPSDERESGQVPAAPVENVQPPVIPSDLSHPPHEPPVIASAAQDHAAPPAEIPAGAERRQLTVLSCELVDAATLAAQLDPEELHAVIHAFQATCTEVVRQFDGHIAQYLDHGLLVYFGYPQAHEDDAQRAIRTGLRIAASFGKDENGVAERAGSRLAVHVGIHSGPMVVGPGEGGSLPAPLAVGATSTLAGALRNLASPQTVVISDSTARLVQGHFALKALGVHTLPASDRPLEIYQVDAASGLNTRIEVEATRGLTPFVGRGAERALLEERWERAKEGLGQVVLISGEAGIGKSRLVQGLTERVAGEELTWFTCRSSPYYQNTALYPLTDLLPHLLHWQPEDSPAVQLAKLEATLRQFHLPLETSVPLFASLLLLPMPEERYPPSQLSPQRQRQQTLDALLALLMAMAEQQPLCFVLEDLHWTDPSTLEWLGLLIEHTPTAAILVVLTCRPAFAPAWGLRSYLTPITLSRLTKPQIAHMVARLTGDARLPAEVVQEIGDKTDGVPLFVEELTKSILESGVLNEIHGHYELTAPLSSLSLPATLQGSLMARLDRLGPAKHIAQLGATIGRQFSYELLHAIVPLEAETLQRELGHLVAAELLYQRGVGSQATYTYTFKHALVQDAAYQSLLRGTRQRYHNQIAQVLEERFPETVEMQPERLAHHFAAAGQHEKATDYWHRAGLRANERSAYPEAVACFEQALDALRHLPECETTREKAFDLRIEFRHALFPLRNFDQLLTNLHEAENLARILDDPYRLGLAATYLGHYFWIAGEPTRAAMFGQRAAEFAGRSQHFELQMVANKYIGYYHHTLGNYQQAKNFLMSLVVSLKGEQQYRFFGTGSLPAVIARVWLSWTLAEMGEFSEAVTHGEEGLHIAEEVDHPYSLNHACFGLGLAYLRHGAFDRAIPVLQRGDTIARAYSPVPSPVNQAHLGYALALSGRVEAGIPLLEEAVERATATRVLFYHSLWVAWLSEAYLPADDVVRAHALALQALELSQNREERGHQAWALRLLGEIFRRWHASEVRPAKTYYQQALTLASELGMRPLQAHCHRGLGILYRQTGRLKQSRAELSMAIEMYRAMETTFWLPETKSVLTEMQE